MAVEMGEIGELCTSGRSSDRDAGVGVFEDILDLFLETAVTVGGAHGGAVVSRCCCCVERKYNFLTDHLLKRLPGRFAPYMRVVPRSCETGKGRVEEKRGGCHAGLVAVT